MGKRKERRLAAMMAAGRRVKLDLFAEPTGELVEDSLNGAGGGFDQNDCRGAPKSPSSSELLAASKQFGDPGGNNPTSVRKAPANPLLLLGQYSDDELEEMEGDAVQGNSMENSLKEKVSELSDAESHDTAEDNNSRSSNADDDTEEHVMKRLDPLQGVNHVDDTGISNAEITILSGSFSEADGKVITSSPPESRYAGDVTVVWKAVMDEQSGRCYYWNVVTGETSWERPHAFIPEMLSVGVEGVTASDVKRDGAISSPNGVHAVDGEHCTAGDVSLVKRSELGTSSLSANSNIICDTKSNNVPEVREDGEKDDMEVLCLDNVKGGILSTDLVSASKDSAQDAQTLIAVPGEEARHVHPVNADSLDNGRNLNGSYLIQDEECKEKLVDIDRLVECCNSLLQRLNELDRLDDTTQGRNRRSKYASEVEIRFLDCKALYPFGFSLLPLWLHYEARLKQLTDYINEEEGSLVSKSDHGNAVGSQSLTFERSEVASQQNLITENGINKEVYHMGASAVDRVCATAPKVTVVDKMVQPCLSDDLEYQIPCNTSSKGDLDGELAEGEIQSNTNLNSEIGRSSGECISEHHAENGATSCMGSSHHDVDMEVDMEVDDDTTKTIPMPEMASSISNIIVPGECQGAAPPPSTLEPLPPTTIPVEPNPCPPPEEDWIPPPPPDSDPIPPPPDSDPIPPPPPDDDPVEPQYASSSLHPHHENLYLPLPYTQHYSFTYTVLGGDCYEATTSEIPDANFYSHGVNTQLVEAYPQSHVALVNPIPGVPSVINNPVEPAVLYELPSTTLPFVPTITVEPSVYFNGAGTIPYNENVNPVHGGSMGVAPEVAHGSYPSAEVEYDASLLDSTTNETVAPVTSLATLQVVATTTVSGNSGVSTAVVSAPAAITAKSSLKAVRVKKKSVAVAPTFRSNKMVSTLVDKWKAAKEELHAEEDKPANAYEILERKRQREIEEWHAKQIANREAHDNANFQPLGGDWREKVKRKRAAHSTGESQTQFEQEPAEQQQQADLTKLSESLPSGWQAYWDESTGQVYYGNSLTLETSWTRPKS